MSNPRLMLDGQPVTRIDAKPVVDTFALSVNDDSNGVRRVQKSAILFWCVTAGPPERYWPVTQSGTISTATLMPGGRVFIPGERLHKAFSDWLHEVGIVEVGDD